MHNPIVLRLEVLNSFEHPHEGQHLAEELADMSARLEDSPDFTEEDLFLTSAFDSGAEADESNLDIYATWVATLSRQFPDLIFSVDIQDVDTPEEDASIKERWYIRDGRRQVVVPYMVIPEFDPDDAGEEL